MYPVLLLASLLSLALIASPARGHSGIGSLGGVEPFWLQGEHTAAVHLFLVKDCAKAGFGVANIGTKCFESVATLIDAVWGDPVPANHPSAENPFLVDIGPGDFPGIIQCPDGEGYVTFRGAGRDRTVIKGVTFDDGLGFTTESAVAAKNCNALGFADMTFEGHKLPGSGSLYGVAISWKGGGSSSWTDVDIVGDDYGWYDVTCPNAVPNVLDPPLGVHYFFGSKVVGGNIAGYYAECGETWFFGGEIDGLASVTGSFGPKMCAVRVAHRGRFHLIGSAARVSTVGSSTTSGDVYGVRVGTSGQSTPELAPNGNGEFDSHGSAISVDSSNLSGISATGLQVKKFGSGSASAVTLGTAFAIKGGSTSTRLSGDGKFESPQLWEPRITPPPVLSFTGQDMYVETDCNADPVSSCSNGSQPHLMIYKAACTPPGTTTPPWFDTSTGACRVD